MSTALANQIAAGEVVVRPASCVKEIIENSLDAGAKTIHVTIREGGISEIVVLDDGTGMDEADAVLSFRRHATSKVFDERDLVRIRTLGFRGEALASIAAVSRVTLTTRTAASEAATEIHVEGGEMASPRRVGAAVGTRIQVNDLFYNTPARLKYLRTVQTEQAKSVEVVQQAALSRPDVSFTCQTEHHVLFQTPGTGDVRSVLAALYGVGEAKQLIAVESKNADYEVRGFIGRPTQARGTRAHAFLFINGRPVRNIAVHQAVVQGYKNRLMVGKQPMYAIRIEMDPSLLDVNVHPHKAEVRFSEEGDVTRCVARAVADALDEKSLAPTPERHIVQRTSQAQPLALNWTPGTDNASQPQAQRHTTVAGGDAFPRLKSGSNRYEAGFRASGQQVTAAEAQLVYGIPDGAANVGDQTEHEAVQSEPFAQDSVPLRKADWHLRPVGQALGMYVIADDGESLYIIDQHAAHERILFEQFDARLRTRAVHPMPLLAPISITLAPSAFASAMAQQARLEEVGLSFDHFGQYDIVVRTVPDIWEGLDVPRLVTETFDDLVAGTPAHPLVDHMHNVIATRACKAAVKANWFLSQPEMDALCHALTTLDDPFHCPHGRPIFLQWTDKQLEKEFRRIV